MNMREPLARAMFPTSLKSSDLGYRSVDHLAALAKCDRLASLLWRLRYGHDRTCLKPAVALLSRRVHDLAGKHRWRYSSPDIFDKMAALAIAEWVEDSCPKCHGTGRKSRFKECAKCNGTGKLVMSQASRASMLGISSQAFAKSWDDRYFTVQSILTMLDIQANRQVNIELDLYKDRQ